MDYGSLLRLASILFAVGHVGFRSEIILYNLIFIHLRTDGNPFGGEGTGNVECAPIYTRYRQKAL